jgi:hypothetical protein
MALKILPMQLSGEEVTSKRLLRLRSQVCGSVLGLSLEEQLAASHEAQRRALAFGNQRFCDAFWKVLVFAGIFQEEKKEKAI